MTIVARIPENNKPARLIATELGLIKNFSREKVWDTSEGLKGLTFWSLDFNEWKRLSTSSAESGKEFLEKVYAEKSKFLEQELEVPTLSTYFYHMLGITVKMLKAGQVEKGVILYNRFARFAGIEFISLISVNPLLISISGTIIQLTGGLIKVIKC